MSDYESLLKRSFEAGDRHDLIRAIGYYLDEKKPLPEWVETELAIAAFDFEIRLIKSWDDIFGKPFPGKSRKGLRKQMSSYLVWKRVREHKSPIPEVFVVVAEELKREGHSVGKASTVRDLYYFIERRWFGPVKD